MPINKKQDEEDDESQTVWWKMPFGFSGGARGRHLSHLVFVSFLAIVILMAIWAHDQSTVVRTKENQTINLQTQKQLTAVVEEIKDKQDQMREEIVYVLTRTEDQRKSLNLQMPDSLRKRMQR